MQQFQLEAVRLSPALVKFTFLRKQTSSWEQRSVVPLMSSHLCSECTALHQTDKAHHASDDETLYFVAVQANAYEDTGTTDMCTDTDTDTDTHTHTHTHHTTLLSLSLSLCLSLSLTHTHTGTHRHKPKGAISLLCMLPQNVQEQN